MDSRELGSVFQSLDKSCTGFLTVQQLQDFLQQVFYITLSTNQIEAAFKQVCGSRSKGVTIDTFEDVLCELDRRQNTEEQAYWDFQALDITGANRISLRDAQLLFKEYHGDSFSVKTWQDFLKSRRNPNADICFDEISLWLCNIPVGVGATEDEFRMEEDRSLSSQNSYWEDALSTSRSIQEDQLSREKSEMEYVTSTYWGAQRKLDRWKKLGLKAMLLDEDADIDDMIPPTQISDHVTVTDVAEAIDQKYKCLRELVLVELSSLVAVTDDEKSDLFQQLLYDTEQFRRRGSLNEMVLSIPEAKLLTESSLPALMGPPQFRGSRNTETDELRTLRTSQTPEKDIRKIIEKRMFEGAVSFGDFLVDLETRYSAEKSANRIDMDQSENYSHMPVFCKLMRQLMLIKGENSFMSASITAGLAEREQQYSGDGEYSWDRCRSERLAKAQIKKRNLQGKNSRVQKEALDEVELQIAGHMDLVMEFISQITKKHTLEKEALLSALDNRQDCGNAQEQMKQLCTHYRTWRSSSVTDASAWHKIIPQAVGLLYRKWVERLTSQGVPVTESLISCCLLTDLQLRQEEEFHCTLQKLLDKPNSTTDILRNENRALVFSHYENIAYIVFGETEVSTEEKEYIQALEKKYDSLREHIIVMALQLTMNWKSMSQDEKKNAVLKRKREEKKMRTKDELAEMERLVGHKHKHLPLRVFVGEEKHEFESRLQKGSMSDESADGGQKPLNLLADLIPRYENEQDHVLNWLRSRDTKGMSLRMKKMKIIHLVLEKFCIDMELDFEVAGLRLGLVERISAVLKEGRHNTDQHRQSQLAKRRTYLRRRRVMQGEEYVKPTVNKSIPVSGDIMGWQMTYLKEVVLRHLEEQEVLLNCLQDESLEELLEPAAMMTAGEREQRLMELRDKRSKLDLKKQGDREENLSILEEATAIGAIQKQVGLQGSSGVQKVSLEEVTVAVLRDLQDSQDKELATVLYGLANMDEMTIEEKVKKERDARRMASSDNVLFCLTQCKEDETEAELITVVDKKYDMLQNRLLVDTVISYIGPTEWKTWSASQKQQKLDALKSEVEDFLKKGNSPGLRQVIGDTIGMETVSGLMGVNRQVFRAWLTQKLEAACDISDPEKAITPRNADPFSDLRHRLDQDKDWLHSYLRGEHGNFPSWWDKSVLAVKIWRETWLASEDSSFIFAALTSGLLERPHPKKKPVLNTDRDRYLRLAKNRLEMIQTQKKAGREKEPADVIIQDKNKTALMESLLKILERTHQQEREMFVSMLTREGSTSHQAKLPTQQQRRAKLKKLQTERTRVRGETRRNHEILQAGTEIKSEECLCWLSFHREGDKITQMDVHHYLLGDLLYHQNCMVETFLISLSDKGELTSPSERIRGVRRLQGEVRRLQQDYREKWTESR
ncbi:hypothetical protein ScPMuIL_008805 [Solemya velum]